MPAPRAVLADIHDLNLDPTKAWSITDKAGRITPNPKAGAKPAGNQYHMGFHQAASLEAVETPTTVAPVVSMPTKKVELPKKVVISKPAPVVSESNKETAKSVDVVKLEAKPVPTVEASKPVEKPTDEVKLAPVVEAAKNEPKVEEKPGEKEEPVS